MKLERFNVVRETENKREIEYFKSIGFKEVTEEVVKEEAEEPKPKAKKKAVKEQE